MIDREINPFEDDSLSGSPEAFKLARVAGVYSDGLSLKFPGESATTKHYPCNQYCKFSVGQRVLVQKVGEVYIAICPVGAPSTNVAADTATYWKNQASGIADVMVSYSTFGTIFTKTKADAADRWSKFSGTGPATP